jgi:hypothetical protein
MRVKDGGVSGVSEQELSEALREFRTSVCAWSEAEYAKPRLLEHALSNFKASVFAWSDAEYAKPRTAVLTVRHRSWRLAAGWALGCVLVAGSVSGGVYERHHRQELAKIAAMREAERQRLAAEQRVREEDEFLAMVDKEVSQEAPSAMEPLAQLMADDEAE